MNVPALEVCVKCEWFKTDESVRAGSHAIESTRTNELWQLFIGFFVTNKLSGTKTNSKLEN